MRQLFALLTVITLAACATTPGTQQKTNPDPTGRTFAILSINDVYRIEGLPSGHGGLARVRSLRAELEQRWPDLLVMHGGDLLFPSLLSREFKGAQMIDVLNHLDGTEPGFDDRLFVVFGNHEFDKGGEKNFGLFADRLYESDFNWMATNIRFSPFGKRATPPPNVLSQKLITTGGVRVGIFSLTLNVRDVGYAKFLASDPELKAIAAEQSRQLREQGAEMVIALTHLPWTKDKMLLAEQDGPDLIIGGHEHNQIDITENGKRLLKADADAITARVTTVTLNPGGQPTVQSTVRELSSATMAEDPEVSARANWWQHRVARLFCGRLGRSLTCLDEELATVPVELVGEEIHVRSEQTNLGDWITDLMLASAKQSLPPPPGTPMIALINSGALRLNQNLAAGTSFTRLHLEELVQYSDPLYVLRLTGSELQKALSHGVSCRESGPWLQVAGVSFDADPVSGRASNIRVQGRALSGDDPVHVVTSRFLADPAAYGDQDLYAFRADQFVGRVTDAKGKSVQIKSLIKSEMDSPRGLSGLRPQASDRIHLTTTARRGGPGSLCAKK